MPWIDYILPACYAAPTFPHTPTPAPPFPPHRPTRRDQVNAGVAAFACRTAVGGVTTLDGLFYPPTTLQPVFAITVTPSVDGTTTIGCMTWLVLRQHSTAYLTITVVLIDAVSGWFLVGCLPTFLRRHARNPHTPNCQPHPFMPMQPHLLTSSPRWWFLAGTCLPACPTTDPAARTWDITLYYHYPHNWLAFCAPLHTFPGVPVLAGSWLPLRSGCMNTLCLPDQLLTVMDVPSPTPFHYPHPALLFALRTIERCLVTCSNSPGD